MSALPNNSTPDGLNATISAETTEIVDAPGYAEQVRLFRLAVEDGTAYEGAVSTREELEQRFGLSRQVDGWEVQLDPGVANWTRSLEPVGPTIEHLSEIVDWAMRKIDTGPQGSTVVDARSMLYLDSLATLRVYYHAEPSNSRKGLVRVWKVKSA